MQVLTRGWAHHRAPAPKAFPRPGGRTASPATQPASLPPPADSGEPGWGGSTWGPRGRWPQVLCAMGSSAGSLQGGLGAGDWSCCTEAPSPGWKPTGCWETTPGARLRKGSWGLLRGTPQPKRWVRVGGSMSPSQMRQRLPGHGGSSHHPLCPPEGGRWERGGSFEGVIPCAP